MKARLKKPPSPAWAFLLGGAMLLGTYVLSFVPGTVQPEQLTRLIDRADRVAVFGSYFIEDETEALYQSAARRDLDELKVALRTTRPPEFRHCLCMGTTRILLYRRGRQIGSISNQHCKHLRCSLWISDAPIADVQAFLGWFDRRQIKWPREEYEEDLREAAEREREEQVLEERLRPAQ
jgi:hypothetical protein